MEMERRQELEIKEEMMVMVMENTRA